jgi:simple sugar transport system permease protein
MENLTAGKGYIALGALILGRYTPVGSLLASLLFGFADGLQLRMQTAGSLIPFQFLSMMPYVLTIIAMVSFSRNTKAPAALGKPYSRQS